MILRTIANLDQFGHGGKLGGRQAFNHPVGKDRAVALPHLAQDETDLIVQDVVAAIFSHQAVPV